MEDLLRDSDFSLLQFLVGHTDRSFIDDRRQTRVVSASTIAFRCPDDESLLFVSVASSKKTGRLLISLKKRKDWTTEVGSSPISVETDDMDFVKTLFTGPFSEIRQFPDPSFEKIAPFSLCSGSYEVASVSANLVTSSGPVLSVSHGTLLSDGDGKRVRFILFSEKGVIDDTYRLELLDRSITQEIPEGPDRDLFVRNPDLLAPILSRISSSIQLPTLSTDDFFSLMDCRRD